MTGTKFGCGIALCGACTVYVDGQPARACITGVGDVAGKSVTTIEGLSGHVAEIVQTSWTKLDVPQCGYCQSGQVMAATALLVGEQDTERFRHRQCDERQSLPLQHLSPYSRGRA